MSFQSFKDKNMKKNTFAFVYILITAFPALLLASTPANTFTGLICQAKDAILYVVPFILTIAVVLFLIGLVKYVGNGDNEEKRTEGTKLMVYGVIGLFVIVAVWSLVSIVVGTFGFSVAIPQFKGSGSGGC